MSKTEQLLCFMLQDDRQHRKLLFLFKKKKQLSLELNEFMLFVCELGPLFTALLYVTEGQCT